MGKPGGFFKKLKAKQNRTSSRQRRGTKGAPKEERRRKFNERVEYYAAKREADELDALSDSSEDKVSTDSEKENWVAEKKLRKLRSLLGVTKQLEQNRRRSDKNSIRPTHRADRKNFPAVQNHRRKEPMVAESDDSKLKKNLSQARRSTSSNSSVLSGQGPSVPEQVQPTDRSISTGADENSVASSEDWEAYLGREGASTGSSDSRNAAEDEEQSMSSAFEDEEDKEELLMDYGEDTEVRPSSDSLDLDEEEEAVKQGEGEANPLFDLINDEKDDQGDDLRSFDGEIVFESHDIVEPNEESYVDDDSAPDSDTASISGAAPLGESVEKQRERRALLPRFKLGTTNRNTILRSNEHDPCYQKYHLDQHGGVDQSPLRTVPVRPDVLEALKHSNDTLIAAVEALERKSEASESHIHTDWNAIPASSNRRDPRSTRGTDALLVSAAEYRMVDPSNIAVAATLHAQRHWLHEPFAVGKEKENTRPSLYAKSTEAMTASRKQKKKENVLGTPTEEQEALLQSRPLYLHETLWEKWVAYRRSYPRNHHFPASASHLISDGLQWLSFEERGLLDLLQGYPDLLDCVRCWQNSASRRDIFLLHILNHWFKMRAVVVANDAILRARHHQRQGATRNAIHEKKTGVQNAKSRSKTENRKRKREADGLYKGKSATPEERTPEDVEDSDEDEDLELRDRGFSKTRILVMLPMRNQAYRYVHTIVRILNADPERCPKLDTFSSDFTEIEEAVDPTFKRRPKDYQRQFDGNIDDSFCVGLRIEPDRVHVYAHPLNSDIIICSPLGLRRRLEKNGDIMISLSSIEVCVIDEVHVLLEQNWDHVSIVLGMLNKRPTDTTHGLSDLRRVYAWALEGKSGRHRQTIFSTNISHAIISSSFRASLNNSGKILLQRHHDEGVLSHVLAPVRQNFIRFDATAIESVDDERFEMFVNKIYQTKIHPLVERNVRTIIFVPSYFQFVRLRNYMHHEYRETYVAISEYTSVKRQRQALGQFTDLERPLLLLTERFYFFRRYFVKFAEILFFYSPPLFPEFYTSLVNRIVATSPNAFATTLYCKYDTHELSRIVGTKRAAPLLERESGIFSFITS